MTDTAVELRYLPKRGEAVKNLNLRLSESLLERIRQAASDHDRSMNEEVLARLEHSLIVQALKPSSLIITTE